MMKIAIIGAGNMGGAIAEGILQSGMIAPENICISDRSEEKLNQLRVLSDKWLLSTSNTEILDGATFVILAVKPWLIETVAQEIRNKIDDKTQSIVSIAAGVSFADLEHHFGMETTLFRLIPNTAIAVRESVSVIAYSSNASPSVIEQLTSLFNVLGKTFVADNEQQLNAFMSLASCGIAYAFRYIRAATEGGVELGIYPNIAKEVVLQTLRGAITLLETNKLHPEEEIDKVTTPGGITIQGLNEMEAHGFSNSVIKGLKKSKKEF